MAGRPKGYPKTGGRVKGKPSKNTALLKDMILAALSGAGGIKYLQTQAIENPSAFMTLVGKVLPLQVTGDGGGPLQVTTVDYAAALAVAASQDTSDDHAVH